MAKTEGVGERDRHFLEATVPHAEAVLKAQEPWDVYDAGSGFHSMAMGALSPPDETEYLPELQSSVYLIWGALTDEMDAPGRGSPEQNAEAVVHMKQAASEWLNCLYDADARAEYLDRWVHDECGYERPAGSG